MCLLSWEDTSVLSIKITGRNSLSLKTNEIPGSLSVGKYLGFLICNYYDDFSFKKTTDGIKLAKATGIKSHVFQLTFIQ